MFSIEHDAAIDKANEALALLAQGCQAPVSGAIQVLTAEHSPRLSGGEQQRVVIVRVMTDDQPAILVRACRFGLKALKV